MGTCEVRDTEISATGQLRSSRACQVRLEDADEGGFCENRGVGVPRRKKRTGKPKLRGSSKRIKTEALVPERCARCAAVETDHHQEGEGNHKEKKSEENQGKGSRG